MKYCSSGKKRHRDKTEALNNVKCVNKSRDTKLRVYYCNECYGWHLSSTSTGWRKIKVYELNDDKE